MAAERVHILVESELSRVPVDVLSPFGHYVSTLTKLLCDAVTHRSYRGCGCVRRSLLQRMAIRLSPALSTARWRRSRRRSGQLVLLFLRHECLLCTMSCHCLVLVDEMNSRCDGRECTAGRA
jgi:hypothetical protein